MSEQNRRDFLKSSVAALGATSSAFAAKSDSRASGRVIGANDRINVGVIGFGGRGSYVANQFARFAEKNKDACRISAVCDVWEKRKREGAEKYGVKGYIDYREMLAETKDLDAVIVATPDHWHGKIAVDAMDKGKDVYLEKPMTHTNEEAHMLVNTVKETKRVLQVGSQTTSADIWWKAKKAIADGMIGKMLMSQGSYHRNSFEGEWNWTIDKAAGPNGKGDDYINWDMFLGHQFKLAPKRPYDADRYFRFRKYWDYSGGIATDLFYHVVAPLNICWDEPQFPSKVMATGGIYVYKDEREVPDTFHLMAEFPKGHSLVLSSSMANDTHIPGLIRGHEGTIMIVPGGQFEGRVDYITVTPQVLAKPKFKEKYGSIEMMIECEPRESHMENFLRCVKTREKPVLDALTAYKAMVTIGMSVQSYREGRVLYFDEHKQKVISEAPKL
jgi:predicted dehydrogenase